MSEVAEASRTPETVDQSRRHTGIPWIGEIPEHWQLRRLRYLCRITTGDGDTQDAEEEGRYPFFVRSDTVERSNRYIFDGEGVLTSGDGAGVGEIYHHYSGKMAVHQRVYLLHSFDSVVGRYLYYYMKANFMKRVQEGTAKSTVDSLRLPMLQDFPVVFPPEHEQEQLINFLDQKTAAVDELIAKKERLIELLEEKRAALINRAVTRGLDPDVPMKDSGVPWIGEIPAHWDVVQLRRVVANFVDYRGKTPPKTKSGIPLITAGAIKDGRIQHENAPDYISEETYDEWMVRGFPAEGDVLLTTEAPLGETARVEDPAIALAQRIILLKANRQLAVSDWLYFYFLSEFGQAELWSRASGSTALGIKGERLRHALVLLPPKEEQEQIFEQVEAELSEFHNVRKKITEQLKMLHEYRQSLITSAVTGQVEIQIESGAAEVYGVGERSLVPASE
ncbi:hypothetical protein FIV42_05455 [Persicimonas caeni]|uniref:Type I restriction modification DNA specificity domain-containing protein n=1 Tax=Persicimonas caeni TaxID=2292766 RepID=A0A4Y6PPF7_PERCE|nr:restriction endonuclease subunit S [Persicimonas caeni]QDG50194.1 hypothetical protein FIV42_05455 [Persicimonas caeni]QED31415.1 hypothetical protein FRD00_05450 [Persicimonas caeni]